MKGLIQKVLVVFMGIIFLFIFFSCQLSTPRSSYTCTVSFKVSDAGKLVRGTNLDSKGITATEVVYIDITKESPTFMHMPLLDGINSVTVPKEGIYVFALVGRESFPKSLKLLSNERSIEGSISVIGNINIVSANLDSLPLQEKSKDELNLGDLKVGNNSFESDIGLSEVEDALAYTTEDISSFGVFDNSLLKTMNPDINRNGVYDTDEDLLWRLSSTRMYIIEPTEYDIDTDTINIPIERFQKDTNFTLIFWHNDAFNNPPTDKVWMILPDTYNYTDINGNTITKINPTYYMPGGSPEMLHQYYFVLEGSGSVIQSPNPPYNGNYILDLDGDLYYINNVNFLNSTKYGSEGFILPLVKLTFNDNDVLTTLQWKWYKVHNNSYIPASPAEIKLQIRQFYFEYWDPIQFNVPYYENGTIDVASYGKTRTDIEKYFVWYYWDRAENHNGFHLHMPGY